MVRINNMENKFIINEKILQFLLQDFFVNLSYVKF